MAAEVNSSHASLPLPALERMERVCLEFEAAWKQGFNPQIEDYVGAAQSLERSELLRELLLLDVDYRSRREEHPSENEYQVRFPQDSQLISVIFEELATAKTVSETGPISATSVSRRQTFPCQFGQYELLDVLGQGGMGIVYQARQQTPNRIVALKIIRPDRLAVVTSEQREKAIERFHAEAQAAARLEHEHIVPVYEVGQVEGQPFFSMRYVQGRGLDELLRDRPLSGREAAALLEPITRALQYAHQHGIIHRDVKPRNILLDTTGRPYVTDFGLAKSLAEAQEITQTQDVIGTLAYMSPEQARAPASVDRRTDVYSIGATLYGLVTGRPPFRAATPAETQRQVAENEPVPIRQLNPAVDRDLETICLKCLDKEPARRFPSAEALADDLARYLEGKPILARPLGITARTIRWARRRPAIAGLLSALAASLLIGTCVSAYYALEANQRAVEAEQRKRQATELAGIAREREQKALDLAAIAEGHRRRAEEQSRIADRQRETAERFLYAANMQLGQRAWEEGKPWLMLKLLDAISRRGSGNDLRGWEWYFLRGMAFGDRQTLEGHASLVDALAWSPDGRRLASTGPDESLRIWNVDGTPDVLIVRRGDGQSPNSSHAARSDPERCRLSWSPDNQHVLISPVRRLSSGGILVCDAMNGQILLRTDGGQGAWNNDGSKLGFVDRKARLRLWTPGAEDAQEIPTPCDPRNSLQCFAWRPDGSQYVLGASLGKLICVDANTHQPTWTMDGQPLPILGAWSPDGRQFAMVSRTETRLWEAASGQLKHTLSMPISRSYDDAVNAIWSPDGRWLTIVDPDGGPHRAGLIQTWDAQLGTESQSVDGKAATWNFESSRLATISGGLLSIWEAGTWKKISTLAGHLADGYAVAWQPDGDLIATGAGDRTVKIWDANAAPLVRDLPGFRWVAWSPDGSVLAVHQADDTIRGFDAATGQETLRWEGFAKPAAKRAWPTPMTWLDWSPDGTTLAWCEVRSVEEPEDRAETSSEGTAPRSRVFKNESHLFLFGAGGGEPIHSIMIPGRAYRMAWCPDSKRIAAAIWDGEGEVNVLAADDGEVVLRIRDVGRVYVAWSGDGRTLAANASSQPAGIRLWDAQTGDKLGTLRISDGTGVGMSKFSHDGCRLAALGKDRDTRTGLIIVWDVATGKIRQTVSLQDRSVLSLAWSPDDRRLVTAGTGEVTVWDAEIGQELLTFREPTDSLPAIARSLAVSSAAWSPDSRYLAVGSITGVKLWDSRKGCDNEAPIEPGDFRRSGYPIQSGGGF